MNKFKGRETDKLFNNVYLFSCSVMSDSLWPHGLPHQASLSITNSQSLLKLMSIESVMPSNHLILDVYEKLLITFIT